METGRNPWEYSGQHDGTGANPQPPPRGPPCKDKGNFRMNSIIYIAGLVLIVLFILSMLGMR
ncbi:MAG TPA: hypothetical protein GXX24_12010 [Paracoccus solventivorans]|uniref:Uncharacterized protein n=1 Tax=Paracoccus solventivorans TaxID=53463 RepID=A0A832QWR4_9RHOB|nr:hypothetical protein [Paracoccus solventivorans]HHW34847.1 hypothetical protein [Paracoccus solventivorans]